MPRVLLCDRDFKDTTFEIQLQEQSADGALSQQERSFKDTIGTVIGRLSDSSPASYGLIGHHFLTLRVRKKKEIIIRERGVYV